MIQAGILSDTHLPTITEQFRDLAKRAFCDCDLILHAGDITNSIILDVFDGKPVHAVHGNMCNYITRNHYPEKRLLNIGGFTIGLCHGFGPRHSIEERMWSLFPDADCIVYGHTHAPVCHNKGGILFINPGSFQCTSHFSAPASYAILQIEDSGLSANLHTISILK